MRKTNGFKKGNFKVIKRSSDGKYSFAEVSGYVSGDIGVEKKQSGTYTYWQSYHLPSGSTFGCDFATRQKAFDETKAMLEKISTKVVEKGIEQFENLLKILKEKT